MKIINYLMATLSLATMLACSNHSEIQSPITLRIQDVKQAPL